MSNTPDLTEALWAKSSYSNGDGGDCVEIADNLIGIVPVRDSKFPHRAALAFSAPAWGAFVSAVRRDGFPG